MNDPELMGTCDTCNAEYDTSSRDGRCGDCGECATHCEHPEYRPLDCEEHGRDCPEMVCVECGDN